MDVLGLFWIPDFVFWILISAVALYIYGIWTHGALDKYGYKGLGPKPKPFIGNNDLNYEQGHTGAWDLEGKKLYGKTFVVYEGRVPSILTFDVDILKQIMVKQFNKFTDRRELILRGKKMGRTLLDLHGDEWRTMRNMMTPFFSSGKLKSNFSMVEYCVNNLKDRCDELAETGEVFDIKFVTGAYAVEAICLFAFGVKINSKTDPDHILITIGKKFMEGLNPVHWTYKWIWALFPFVFHFLDWCGVVWLPPGTEENLTRITREAIADRKNSKKEYPDFIQAMIKAHEQEEGTLDSNGMRRSSSTDFGNGMPSGIRRNSSANFSNGTSANGMKRSSSNTFNSGSGSGGLRRNSSAVTIDASNGQTKLIEKAKALTEDEIIGQVCLFLIAGYDTVSSTCMFLLYNLGMHPVWQDKILEEINDVFGDEAPTYDKLQECQVLDMCIAESQRLFPSLSRLDRTCTESCTIKGHYFPKGTLINIPVWGLHHDPEYWDDPWAYNPERFSPENKAKIEPFAYHPFGTGPRNCVGMRLAKIEVKMAAITIIKNYIVKVADKTKKPLTLTPGYFAMVETGVWLQLEKRSTDAI